ncbi:MAPEG family protein [Pseudomarimonas arenosa]|uniref:MAPEG family protein n=1 Tax=Pseudomarimonas arenosa TaxID=2774145 RepID=A0AAW3ZUR4_9GAMM|nr:MAPEG family protein [Pseudomarimonas arenosa]MBD8527826.1 MAPEG family protein [Pseudomarimonas arenosa]
MPTGQSMLAPVIALCLWCAVIWVWLYATRIPAIIQMRMRLDGRVPRGEQMAQLPASVRWKADNFNHLMEQPTYFFAAALSLALLGDQSAISLGLAWAYVALRLVHSLIQCVWNHIPTRFAVFCLSSLVLFALTIRAALLVF